jgi:DNA helicase-2/ATP-dependent DNA helicase PcrA
MQEYRIFGPPGCGKTHSIQEACAAAADEYGGGGVMICSFTNGAAQEIAARVDSIPEENIGTLHKACFSQIGRIPVLEEKKKHIDAFNEFAPGYKMSTPGCKDIGSGMEYGEGTTDGDKLFSLTTVLRNRMIPVEQWPERARNFYDAWKSFKSSEGGIDYTDMLEIALNDVEYAPGTPRAIFVDEAQDCTALQMAVLKKWTRDAEKLVMVGDDDQCIYQFAGATPEAFASGDLTVRDSILDQSYRVPFAVWEVAYNWISRVKDRVEKDYMPRPEPGFASRAPFSWRHGDDILKTITKAMIRGKSVMVIGACSFMLEPTKKALIEAGVPFHNPYRYIRADWNPLKLTTGTTYAERIRCFLKDGAYAPGDIKAWASVLKADGVLKRGMKSKLDSIDTTSPDYMMEFFEEETRDAIYSRDIKWWQDHLVNDEARKKATYPLKIVNNLGPAFLDAKEIPPQVILGTIHSVKGGEADVVIVFPDLSQEGMQEWTGKGKASIHRLMYVAVTRAREGVIIAQPGSPYTCDL